MTVNKENNKVIKSLVMSAEALMQTSLIKNTKIKNKNQHKRYTRF